MLRRLLRRLIKLAIFVAIIILIIAISRAVVHHYHPNSVLVLELDGPLKERAGGTGFDFWREHGNGLNTIRRALNSAKDDPRIVGLAIKMYDPTLELAQAQELDDLIAQFRARGKWVTAYMETAGEGDFGNLPYMVASAAKEVSMMPQGELNLLGVNMRELFARGLFDWIKVKPVFDAIGKYKDAANIFTQKDYTPAQREEDEALAGDIFTQVVNETASHRHLSPDAIRAIIDRAPLTAADGLKDKLLDRLEYEDQFVARVKSYRGSEHPLIDADSYVGPHPWFWRTHVKIAVIYGIGAITRGESNYDPVLSPGSESMGSDDMVSAFKDAQDDNAVRAVVFRINSPGGSVIASELIRHAVQECANEKPVVVSMGDYAASGGFWIATPAAKLYADPGTVTGSIGVLGGKFDISGAAAALGVNSGAVTYGANAGMFDSFTDFTPAQADLFHNQIAETYRDFVALVAQQRKMSVAQVEAIAQGRVWTGAQALSIKLVDGVGGFDTAFAEAKRLAKLEPQTPVRIEELPAQAGPLTRLINGRLYGEASWRLPRALQPLMRAAQQVLAREGAFGEVYCPVHPAL